MDPRFFRKYANLVESAEKDQPVNQLDEGIMDSVKSLVPKAMKMLGGDTLKQIAQQVKQVTGGDYTPSKENAIAVAKALGFEEMLKAKAGKGGEQVAEGWAGNWQGKLIQLAHLGGLAGAGYAAMNPSMGDPTGFVYEGLLAIGVLLLMIAGTIWGEETGQVGVMGKHGNKGFDTDKGMAYIP
jgi:hypothetical protein